VKNRSVLEIMILTFTFVVAFMVVGIGIMIIIVEMRNPEADTALVASTLMNIVSGIVGALLGLIAGKSVNGKDGL
jgi:multidrug resistance efflux pump